ncbi:hypothetical protein HPB50_010727 [Hyalomma asiaticum]|uniref:Uncharacterized protein n=1 Tax=Hyalomma asiaticum TaxID=266040 RepID=A0ACB7TG74_HYAAI|nr:hypothetical protein HPB50_010727 [Hyalomma asiaticum]
MTDRVVEQPTSMQTELPAERSIPALGWTYEADTGKPTENEYIEWLQVGRRRNQTSEPTRTYQERSTQLYKPTPQAPKQRSPKMPPFPTGDFKIVYRPQASLDLSQWNLTAIPHAIGRSSGLTQQDFYENVRVQMQKIENVIIASTADTERAARLKSISTIQLGGTIFNVNAHVRHSDDVYSGVIYGLLPGTSSAEIVAVLRVDPRYTVLGARMLGRSPTAVITFDEPHLPYYITYQSGDYSCTPYRKSVQYCRKCGAIGHRQDICPRPREAFCYMCGQEAVSEAHDCLPKCKICEQAYEIAGKEYKKKLRPSPPSYQVRQKKLIQAKARECPWNPSCDEFPELNNPPTASGSRPQGQPGPSSSILRSRSRSRARSRSRSRSRSVQRISYAVAAQGDSKSWHKYTSVSPVESAALKLWKTGFWTKRKFYNVIATRSKAKLTTLAEPKSTTVVKSGLEAIVDTKLEPIAIQIGNTFTTLSRIMDTHAAQINDLKSQLTNFIAHVKNNCISHADLANLPGRKKPPTQSKKASRSNSPERERINDPIDGSS